ncbi:hypothetical protein IHE44_0003738 [Lamprotornis superbus]|uniref:Uncharacterized protein n=1 Tax=Lamprotornis superbus TaxID=245042 RepID=A0A835NQX8_9PASS|nr:hypothetical protein IHE44_0003738 [Lamprotornis superbus]
MGLPLTVVCWGSARVTPTVPGPAFVAETKGLPGEGCPPLLLEATAQCGSLCYARAWRNTQVCCSGPRPGLVIVATTGLRLTLFLPLNLSTCGPHEQDSAPMSRTQLATTATPSLPGVAPGKTAACLPAPSQMTSKAGGPAWNCYILCTGLIPRMSNPLAMTVAVASHSSSLHMFTFTIWPGKQRQRSWRKAPPPKTRPWTGTWNPSCSPQARQTDHPSCFQVLGCSQLYLTFLLSDNTGSPSVCQSSHMDTVDLRKPQNALAQFPLLLMVKDKHLLPGCLLQHLLIDIGQACNCPGMELPQFPPWAVYHTEEPFQVALDTSCAMTNKILSVVHTSVAGFSYQTPPTALILSMARFSPSSSRSMRRTVSPERVLNFFLKTHSQNDHLHKRQNTSTLCLVSSKFRKKSYGKSFCVEEIAQTALKLREHPQHGQQEWPGRIQQTELSSSRHYAPHNTDFSQLLFHLELRSTTLASTSQSKCSSPNARQQEPGLRGNMTTAAVIVRIMDNDTEHNDTVMDLLSFGGFLVCHICTCQRMRASLLQSLKLSKAQIEEKHHSKGSMGHSGDFGIIPANHLSSCKHCLEMHRLQGNKHQQVFNQLLQLYPIHDALTIKVFAASQTNSALKSSAFPRVFQLYKSSNWQIPITAQIRNKDVTLLFTQPVLQSSQRDRETRHEHHLPAIINLDKSCKGKDKHSVSITTGRFWASSNTSLPCCYQEEKATHSHNQKYEKIYMRTPLSTQHFQNYAQGSRSAQMWPYQERPNSKTPITCIQICLYSHISITKYGIKGNRNSTETAQYFGCTGFLLSAFLISVAVIFKRKQKGVLKVRKATLFYSRHMMADVVKSPLRDTSQMRFQALRKSGFLLCSSTTHW